MQHALQTVTKNAAEEVVQNTGTPKQKTSWIFIRNKMNAPELSALLTLQALAYTNTYIPTDTGNCGKDERKIMA